MSYKMVDPEKIKSGTINPRQELGDLSELQYSMKKRQQKGKRAVYIPLIVKEIEDEIFDYEVIDGKRRLQSALAIQLPEVPIVLEKEVIQPKESVWMAYFANKDRKDFTWVEEAKFFIARMEEDKLSQEEVGDLAHKSREYIRDRVNTFRNLPSGARAPMLDISIARYIAESCPEEDRKELVELAISNNLKVREILNIIKNNKNMRLRLDILKDNNEKLYEELSKIYFSKRFAIGSDGLLELEINLRTGQGKPIDEFLKLDEYSEEEAKQYAQEHYGEFLGKVTIEAWRIYGIPLTFDEIRAKLEKL